MSLESMKKDDLVKMVRGLTQDVKILEQQVKELSEKESPQELGSLKERELPFMAVGTVIVDKNRTVLVKVMFDNEGNAKALVDEVKPTQTYKAQYEAEKLLNTRIAKQVDYNFIKKGSNNEN